MALFRSAGERWRIGVTPNNVANAASEQGDFAAIVLQNVDELAHRKGDAVAARSFYEAALSQQRALGDKKSMGGTLGNHVELAFQDGDTAAARARSRRAWRCDATWATSGAGLGAQRLQRCLASRGRPRLGGCIPRREPDAPAGDRRQAGIADCLVQAAVIAAAHCRHASGARLLGAAAALRAAIGAAVAPSARAAGEGEPADLRMVLGEAAFAAAWAEGRAAPLEESIAHALALSAGSEPCVPATTPDTMPLPDPRSTRMALPGGLTAWEAEVLGLIAAGHTNREIAGQLVLSSGTVACQIANLCAEIGARGRAYATAYALRNRLVRAPHSHAPGPSRLIAERPSTGFPSLCTSVLHVQDAGSHGWRRLRAPIP